MAEEAAVHTPQRRHQQPSNADRTRPQELESPSQQNLRTSRRLCPNLGRGAHNKSASDAVVEQINAIQQNTLLHYRVVKALAEAFDACVETFNTPQETRLASALRQQVIQTLTASINPPGTLPPQAHSLQLGHESDAYTASNASRDSASSQRTWADVANDSEPQPTPKKHSSNNNNNSSLGCRSNRGNSAQLGKANRQEELARPAKPDSRILIVVTATDARLRPDPFAIRQAICNKIEGLTIRDIPAATPTKTGWAITPANNAIRDTLMEQENRELMIRALGGDSATVPVTWYNYAVQGVASSYQNMTGERLPVTVLLIEEEVIAQTRQSPVNCRPSRHGPDQNGIQTWIISFLRPVKGFRLFNASDYSKLIKKQNAIQRHNPRCQGYCNPAKCTRVARCGRCSEPIVRHEGPAGDGCVHHEKCANCHGPHPSAHPFCPAAPQRVKGRLSKPTKKELEIVRRAGRRAYLQTHALAAEHATRATRTPSETGQTAEATCAPDQRMDRSEFTATLHPANPQGAADTRARKRTNMHGSTATSSASSANEASSSRPRRTTARPHMNLNLRALSRATTRLREAEYTGESSEHEDTSMSEDPAQ